MTIVISIDAGEDMLEAVERAAIEQVLADCDGNVTAAATRLGIHRQSLQRKLRKHGLRDQEAS